MDISLNNGRVRLPGLAVVTCYGAIAQVVQFIDVEDEGECFIMADIALELPPEAKAIDRAALLRQVEARIGRFDPPEDIGQTQDCYGVGAIARVYPGVRGRIVQQNMAH